MLLGVLKLSLEPLHSVLILSLDQNGVVFQLSDFLVALGYVYLMLLLVRCDLHAHLIACLGHFLLNTPFNGFWGVLEISLLGSEVLKLYVQLL